MEGYHRSLDTRPRLGQLDTLMRTLYLEKSRKSAGRTGLARSPNSATPESSRPVVGKPSTVTTCLLSWVLFSLPGDVGTPSTFSCLSSAEPAPATCERSDPVHPHAHVQQGPPPCEVRRQERKGVRGSLLSQRGCISIWTEEIQHRQQKAETAIY